MKRSMLFLAVGLIVLSSNTMAGFKTGQQVVIDTSYGFANADLGYVHNTADTTQYIGCEVYSYPSSSTPYAYCFAQNTVGTYVSCWSSSPALVNAAASLRSDGYLLFYYDTSGNCTFIEQTTASYTAPKAH